ncbi:MAG: DUF3293 domain-containing protein [Deltaproteobacteria bacterium]|nr:DUF3293 domain-containing protein [Deltaproteobacteria bacterium]
MSAHTHLKAPYLTTVFEWRGALPDEFVVLSAHNPHGRSAPPSRNAHQHEALRALLAARGLAPAPVVGRSPSGDHREPSWAVAMPVEEALALARLFKQDALYSVRGGELSLVSTRAGEPPVALGPWAARRAGDPA